MTSASRNPDSSRAASRKVPASRRKTLSPTSPRTSRSSARSFFMSLRASCTPSSEASASASIAWSMRPRAMRLTPSGIASSCFRRNARDTAPSLQLPLEELRRGAGRIEPAGDHLVEQLLHRFVVAHLRLEPAAEPRRGERQHLVHEVAAAAPGQRPLLADVGVVLADLLGQLRDPLAAARLGLEGRPAPALP